MSNGLNLPFSGAANTDGAVLTVINQGTGSGKPKGTLQKSKFDQHLVRIKELLSYGLSVRKIARVLGYLSIRKLFASDRGLFANESDGDKTTSAPSAFRSSCGRDIRSGHTEKVAASGYDTRHVAQCHHSAR